MAQADMIVTTSSTRRNFLAQAAVAAAGGAALGLTLPLPAPAEPFQQKRNATDNAWRNCFRQSPE
jgi:hypothetical protein